MEFLTNNLGLLLGGGSSAVALWLLKRIPNEDLYSWVRTGAYCAGTAMTLGLSKWKFTKKIWNATIEPYFIDLLDNTVGAAVKGFIKGLRSDK
tara:strand:+ start:3345 stop:3623 length:279 start_codon:yes stop_codon:yes gene_type:complete